MTLTELALAPDVAEHWVQSLDPRLATQALIGFGLWSPGDGAAPTDNLDAAYGLAERALGVGRQAISLRTEGSALACSFIYANRMVTALANQEALALTRAILRAAYEARLI